MKVLYTKWISIILFILPALTYAKEKPVTEHLLSSAKLYESQGQCSDAIIYYRKALAADPNLEEANRGIARCQRYLRQHWLTRRKQAQARKILSYFIGTEETKPILSSFRIAAGYTFESVELQKKGGLGHYLMLGLRAGYTPVTFSAEFLTNFGPNFGLKFHFDLYPVHLTKWFMPFVGFGYTIHFLNNPLGIQELGIPNFQAGGGSFETGFSVGGIFEFRYFRLLASFPSIWGMNFTLNLRLVRWSPLTNL